MSTVEHVPGYQFDLGGSAHILIRLTPIVEELGLERFGLEYLELDPLFFAPFPDGDHFFIYRDSEADVERSWRPVSPARGRRTGASWTSGGPSRGWSARLFLAAPSPLRAREALRRQPGRSRRLEAGAAAPSSGPTARWWTSTSGGEGQGAAGVDGGAVGTAALRAADGARSCCGSRCITRAGSRARKGGSGDAHAGAGGATSRPTAARCTWAPASRRSWSRAGGPSGSGRAGEVYTRRASCWPEATPSRPSARLLPEEHRPPAAAEHAGRQRLRRDRCGSRCREPVRYAAHPRRRGAAWRSSSCCRDRGADERRVRRLPARRPAADPPIVAMSFSAVDPSLAPPGGEVLWLWAQYFPYELAGAGLGRDRRRGSRRTSSTAFETLRAGDPRQDRRFLLPAPAVARARAGPVPRQRHAPGDDRSTRCSPCARSWAVTRTALRA